MTINTNLKEIRLDRIPDEEINHYVVNRSKGTAIKIPNKVEKTLEKFRDPNNPASILAADILSFAYHGNKNGVKGARKLVISSLTNPLLNGYFEESEIRQLLNFLFSCPEGYEFTYKPVFAHVEIDELRRL